MFTTSSLAAQKAAAALLFVVFALATFVPMHTHAGCVQLQTYPPQTVCTDDNGVVTTTESNAGSVSTTPSNVPAGCYQLQTYPPQTVCPGNSGSAVPGNPATPGAVTSNLVAFWNFDEMSGTTAYDSSGNGYSGILENGATRYTGTQQGNKLELDGVDDRVRVETSPSARPGNGFTPVADPLSNMNSFTVMAWIRPTEYGGIIVRKGNTSIGRFNFGLRADGVLYLRAGYSERIGSWQTTTPLPLNTWSHVAVTYTYGIGNKPTIYLGGVAQALRPSVANPGTYDSADPLGTPVADTPYLYIGHSFDFVNRAMEGSDGAFEGRMDNVRVYNSALSAAAIAAAKTPEPDAGQYMPVPFPNVIVPSTNAGTVASLQAQLNTLLAQIAALGGVSQVNASMGTSACPSITRTLTRGMRGDDVRQLQVYLTAQGYLAAGNDTGYFGALTEAAVRKWQSAHGIEPVGIVGPQTRAAFASCSAS